jgi:SEC-C motif-containing protein
MKVERNAACPCGSGDKAKRCCLPVVEGARPAATPAALLRARYCAYGWGAVDFLIATTTSAVDRDELVAYCRALRLAGLEILEEGEAEVRYVARLVLQGQAVQIRERARYSRLDSGWTYTGGDLG